MKLKQQVTILAASTLMALSLSGCCTRYVSNIGRSEARLSGKRLLSNSAGDVVVETELVRYRLNDRHGGGRSLGVRYVYMTGDDARQEVSDKVLRGQIQRQRGTNYVQIGKGNFNPEYAGRWQFEPPDVLNKIDRPPLPPHIAQPLQEFVWCRRSEKGMADRQLHYNIDGTNYFVEVSVAASGIWFPEAYHQARWGYPLRILYIPAIAIDVVTSPIQFIWLVREISKWGDGSGL